jgi:hypothetical protein
MRILVFVSSLLTTSVVFTDLGFADSSISDPGAASAASAATPVFAMMDNTGDRSKFEINLATAVKPASPDATIVGWRLAGQYVWPAGYGLYAAAMPASSGLGGIDIGALFHTAPSPDTSIGVRLGVATSLDARDGLVPWLPNAKMRPADLILGLDTTAIRLGISPTFRSQAGFLRLDLGVDLIPDGVGAIIAHGNLGAGIRSGGLSATAELQTGFISDGGETDWFGAVGVSGRLHRDAASPFVMVAKPLGMAAFDGEFTATAGVTLGL